MARECAYFLGKKPHFEQKVGFYETLKTINERSSCCSQGTHAQRLGHGLQADILRYASICVWGGVEGDDDDIGTQTPRTISPQEPFYSVFTVLS